MNISVEYLTCECCSSLIDKTLPVQYIFNENEAESDMQKLIFDCIGKNVTFNDKNRQVICTSCVHQLNQIKEFKHKCLAVDSNLSVEVPECKNDDTASLSSSCDDYEVIEDFLDDEFIVTPLKYVEQIEYKSIENLFKNIEFENMVLCSICDAPLKSHTILIKHILENHVNFGSADSLYYPCNVDKTCTNSFNSVKEINEHVLGAHYSSLQNIEYTKFCLKCLTCSQTFLTKKDFGKHVCFEINFEDDAELLCFVCSAQFNSRIRMNFHYQFHLENARPKICLICLITFNTETDFYNHVMFFHESSYVYMCSFCDQTFSSNQIRQNHEKTHNSEQNYFCRICHKSFLSEQILTEHTICHMKTKPFKCNLCGKQLNRASRLRKHIASHEQPKFDTIYSCDACDECYAEKNHAMEHIKSFHNIDNDEAGLFCGATIIDHVFCCEYCSKVYRTSKYLKEHRKIHDGIVQPYECEYCSSTYDSFSKLRTHKISHEKLKNDRKQFPVQKWYLCRYSCDKSYLHWPDLSHHMNTVHLAKPVTCEICNKNFLYRWNYLYHKKIEHTRKVTFICTKEGCTAKFQDKKLFIMHKKQKHSNVKVKRTCRKCKTVINFNEFHDCYVEEITNCELCGKSFQTVNALKSHIKVVHERVINYHCEFCNRGFYNISDKNIHLRIHTQEKPYQCGTCSFECRTQSTLTEHIRTHTNERPYNCPYPNCGVSFRRSYAMKTHFKIHTGERNFNCGVCSKTFRSQSQLNYHFKKKHWTSIGEQPVRVTEELPENSSVVYDDAIGYDLSNIIAF